MAVRPSTSVQRRTRTSTRLLVAGLGLSVIAAGLVAWIIKSADAQSTVVMVTQPVPAFTTIQASDIQTVSVPTRSLAAGAITSPSQIVGQITDTTLYPNVQITNQELASNNTAASPLASALSQLGNPSLRALGLSANNISFPGGPDIVAGDHVDIVSAASFQVGSGNTRQTVNMSKLVLANVPLLSVQSQGSSVSSVIVAVTPTQAVELTYLQSNGKLSFLLDPYSPNMHASDSAPTVTGGWLLNQYQVTPQGGSTLTQLPPVASSGTSSSTSANTSTSSTTATGHTSSSTSTSPSSTSSNTIP